MSVCNVNLIAMENDHVFSQAKLLQYYILNDVHPPELYKYMFNLKLVPFC